MVAETISGKRPEAIATSLGCHPATIRRNLAAEDIRLKIDALQRDIAERAYKPAIDNIVSVIEAHKNIRDSNKGKLTSLEAKLLDQGYDASVKVGQSVGVLPSHAQAPTVVNLTQINNNQYISALTDRALSVALGIDDAQEKSIVDITPLDNVDKAYKPLKDNGSPI